MAFDRIMIFTGSCCTELASKIVKDLQQFYALPVNLGNGTIGKFSNTETSVKINESVRGADIYVVQSIGENVNDGLMELFIMIDAFKRASAGRITAILPHFVYARQDRKAKGREPITAKLVADLLMTSGANRVLTMDLHAAQIEGFFNIPVDHLSGIPILANYFLKLSISDLVVVSPDIGGLKRAEKLASRLHSPLAIVNKRRLVDSTTEVVNIIGEVENKNVILIDDIIDTAGSIIGAATALRKQGAKNIYACCTHAVLSGNAVESLNNSIIAHLVVLDTTPLKQNLVRTTVLSVSELFAGAINMIHNDLPMSPLFER